MKILIIDDNSTISLTVKVLLERFSFINNDDTFVCKDYAPTNKNEIFEITNNVDLIICDFDLGMDNINGLQFFNLLEDFNIKHCKCVLLTADNSFILKSLMELNNDITYIIKENLTGNNNEGIFQLGSIISEIRNSK